MKIERYNISNKNDKVKIKPKILNSANLNLFKKEEAEGKKTKAKGEKITKEEVESLTQEMKERCPEKYKETKRWIEGYKKDDAYLMVNEEKLKKPEFLTELKELNKYAKKKGFIRILLIRPWAPPIIIMATMFPFNYLIFNIESFYNYCHLKKFAPGFAKKAIKEAFAHERGHFRDQPAQATLESFEYPWLRRNLRYMTEIDRQINIQGLKIKKAENTRGIVKKIVRAYVLPKLLRGDEIEKKLEVPEVEWCNRISSFYFEYYRFFEDEIENKKILDDLTEETKKVIRELKEKYEKWQKERKKM